MWGQWGGTLAPRCPQPTCASPDTAHTHFSPFPPCLVLALGWTAAWRAQEGRRGGGGEPTTLSKWAPAHPSHPGIYRSNEYAVQRLYRRDPGGPGSLWSHLGWAGVTAQTHTLPPYASISPFLTSGTNSKELALPTPTPTPLLLPTPKVLVPSCFCSHTTSGQLCWFCSMFPFLDICYCCCDQLQMFILIASFGSAHVPLLQDAQGKVVWVTDHPSPCP